MKQCNSDDGYFKLVIDENWATSFYLVPLELTVSREGLDKHPKLDDSQYYDIKSSSGRVFIGCKIKIQTHVSPGMGGMSEGSSSSQAFFFADGLEIKMYAGFLLRPNKAVTAKKRRETEKQERENTRKRLLDQKAELDKKIKRL